MTHYEKNHIRTEWFDDSITPERKMEFIRNIPVKIRMKALTIEQIYGVSYIVLTKDYTYDVYYPKDGELVKDG